MTGYEEAVAWFRAAPGRVRDLDDVDNRSAAIAVVNAVLAGAVPAGRDLECGVCGRPLKLAEPKYVHADGKTYRHPIKPVSADRSPRSWSLPAPPPDDVTVVHVEGHALYRGDGSGSVWESRERGKFFRWSTMLLEGTVVEGEPPAPEPQAAEPPRFERGFYRLARDLDDGTGVIPAGTEIVVHGPFDDGVWFGVVGSLNASSISSAALAAAGAVREEDR